MKVRVYAFLNGFIVLVLAAVSLRMLASAFGNSAADSVVVYCSLLSALLLGLYYFHLRSAGTETGEGTRGLIHLAVAIYFLILITILPGMHRAFGFVHTLGPSSPPALLAVKALLSFAVVIIPGFLLGGTIALSQIRGGRRSADGSGGALGALFLGLAAGAPTTLLVLLPRLGVTITLALAAVVSAGMSGASFLARARGAPAASAGREDASGSALKPMIFAGVLVLAFSAVCYAGLWLLVQRQITGSNAYTSASAGAVWFIGLFAGSMLIRPLVNRSRLELFYTGLIALIGVIYMTAAVGVASDLPLRFLRMVDYGGGGTGRFAWAYSLLSVMSLLAPALIVGTAAGVGGGDTRGGRGRSHIAGVLLPAGIGALLGLGAGLPVFSETLDQRTGLIVAAWLCFGGGAALIAASAAGRGAKLRAAIPAVLLVLALTLTSPRWNRSVMTAGAYDNPAVYSNVEDFEKALGRNEIVFYREGLEGVVSVVRTEDGLSLRLDGRSVGSVSERIATDILAAHVPMLLHENPERVLILGLRTGVTLGSVERYDVKEITVAEPVGAVVQAAVWFAPYNYSALEARNINLVPRSPREFMRLAQEKYDVVIGQTGPHTSPLEASTASLEYMMLVRSLLAHDGLFCYRLDYTARPRECLRTTVSTFMSCFPYVTAWYPGHNEFLLVGAMEPMQFDLGKMSEKMERPWVGNDLKRLQIDTADGVLANFKMNREALRTYVGAFSEVQRDGRPRPFCDAVPVQSTADILATLTDFNRFAISPIELITDYEEGSVEYKLAKDRYSRCVDAGNRYVASYEALESGNRQEAARRLEYAVGQCPENGIIKERLSHLYIYVSRDLIAEGRLEEAINVGRRAIEVSPLSYLAFYNLATLESARDPETAITLLRRASQLNPDFVPADLLRSELLLETGNVTEASETVSGVISREPMNRRAHHIRGLCFVERGLTEAARVEFEYVLQADPSNVEALAALGYTWLLVGDVDKAGKYYRKALEIDPDNFGSLNNYATVLAEKGEYRKAIIVWQKALKLDPTNADIKANIQEASQKLRED